MVGETGNLHRTPLGNLRIAHAGLVLPTQNTTSRQLAMPLFKEASRILP